MKNALFKQTDHVKRGERDGASGERRREGATRPKQIERKSRNGFRTRPRGVVRRGEK